MFKDDIINHSLWNEFLNYKLSKDFISDKEKHFFEDYISSKSYFELASKIASKSYSFSTPQKHLISKDTLTKNELYILLPKMK